ncbi:MAG: hypothetical protein D6830_01905 [Ignavibacteria bacterium]|nr:MAG: hypothetical protein D6830_01905 [Ignavibacteria bacterium]
MNYPVWDVSFGSPLLIAIVAIVHVFVSHFAVGGGLFLVLSEKRAYKRNDNVLLEWLKTHTKFFVLLTVVFGVVTGVGIWFTIGLIQPSATSTLIHSFVWGWAIEWVFFFLEITAALLYLYGWDKIDRETHIWLGWIYFIAAFLSMVIINGILAFMLTPGSWIQSHKFWEGFFNPTYFPQLFLRFSFSIALAGVYALVTSSLMKPDEKAGLVKWSVGWIIAGFVFLPLFAYWYSSNIPESVWNNALGLMPTATSYAGLITIFAIITFLLSLIALFISKKVNLIFSLLIFVFAFLTMWSFEFIREAIRKPFVITDYMYANSVYPNSFEGDGGFSPENINSKGVLNSAKWIDRDKLNNIIDKGEQVFRVECMSCHTIDGYRSMNKLLNKKGWSKENFNAMLTGLEHMNNGTMPPFVGNEDEKTALSEFIYSKVSVNETLNLSGKDLFGKYCSSCHQYDDEDPLFLALSGSDDEDIIEYASDLNGNNELMPPLVIKENDLKKLAAWIKIQFNEN